MSFQKPRIIPWLIRQLDNKTYPGLEWVNMEHTQFRVPWKHALRQDRSHEDFKIFEGWAVASGCYDPLKEKPDPPRWKRNFRSALIGKEGIRMIHNNSSDSTNPHKIYEITLPAHGAAHVEQSQISSSNQDLDGTSRSLFKELEHLDLSTEEELYLPYGGQQGAMGEMEPNEALFAEHAFCDNPTITGGYADGAAAAVGACAIYSDGPSYTADAVHPDHVQPQPAQVDENFQQQILKHFSYNSFQTDFEVNIYYRGKLVQSTLVTNPHGFYITAEKHPGPDDYLSHVYLPEPASVVSNQLLVEAVNHLLANLKQGTLVEVREGAICARRLGLCRSYWSMTNTPDTNIPNQIDKTEYSILYSIQQFITELIDFVEKRRKDSPRYSTWICLGEQWPDGKPWQKKCIMVQVIPVTMRLLHELSYSTGASSLTDSDINLEISGSLSSTNNLVSLLRDIEDMMDWD